MLGVLDRGERFDAIVPVPCTARGSGAGASIRRSSSRGVGGGLNAPASDTLQAVRKTRDQVELSAAERRANLEGACAVRGRAGQDPPRRRRLHHRSDDELGRRDPIASRSGRGTRGEPVQDGMKKHAPASPTLSARFAFSTPPGFARRLSASQLRSARHVASLLCAGCLSEGIWRS